MLSIVISDVVADLLHEFHTLAAHIQYLAFGFILSSLLTIAIIHRIFEKAIGYKAVSRPLGYVDGCRRQRKKRGLGAICSLASFFLRTLICWF